MSRILSLLVIFGCVIFSLNSWAQNEGQAVYSDAVFDSNIKSVQFFLEGDPQSMPVINIQANEQLILKFDDLAQDTRNFSYTILHCDANWNESFLIQSEYLDGFFDNPMEDYALSFNTTVDYVNYRLGLPNDRVKMLYPGNYILIIYEGNEREKVVLTRRFYVLNPRVEVKPIVKRATFDPYLGDNQELDFSVFTSNLTLDDPFQEIKVVLMKNRRSDNAIRGLKPQFVRKNELVYDYDKENVFRGGNEFRYFDMRSWEYTGENVERLEEFNGYYHVTIMKDELRSNKKYFNYVDMNGNYSIESPDRIEDPDVDCDYGFVHFTLAMPTPLVGGSVHVFGGFTGWQTSADNAMVWNAERSVYELTTLMKQGYYNYEYVYVPKGATEADESVIEGTHFETENDYQILVYYKPLTGGRFDQLVGFVQVNPRDF